MRICYLSNARSIHTVRWATHFASHGHDVSVVSFSAGSIPGIRVVELSPRAAPSRLDVISCIHRARSAVRELKPDLVHAHYATETSYGLAGALSAWYPFVISMWGSDVLVQPEGSAIYRRMVQYSLSRADMVTSVADHMRDVVLQRRYCDPEKVVTIPFGVDVNLFRQAERPASDPPTIVSTRTLTNDYDVATFVRAMPVILAKNPACAFHRRRGR